MWHESFEIVVAMFRFNVHKIYGKEDFENFRRKNLKLWQSGMPIESESEFPELYREGNYYVVWMQQYQAKGRMGISVVYLQVQNSKHQKGDYSWLTKV